MQRIGNDCGLDPEHLLDGVGGHQIFRCPARHHLPVLEKHQHVCMPGREVKIVQHKNHCTPMIVLERATLRDKVAGGGLGWAIISDH